MTKYRKNLFWSEEDQLWIVEVPELPGCLADGKTPEEALVNSEIIIDEWIQTATALGRTIPAPTLFAV